MGKRRMINIDIILSNIYKSPIRTQLYSDTFSIFIIFLSKEFRAVASER